MMMSSSNAKYTALDGPPPVVQGVPIAGAAAPSVDAVPLIDATTASMLGGTNAFSIVQRPSLTEAFCPACERSNIYDVFDGTTGAHLFIAKERSEALWRCCCAPGHRMFVEFKTAQAVGFNPMLGSIVDIDTLPTVLTMERDGCPSKPCLGCFACCDPCKDGMALHAGPLNPEMRAGALMQANPACVGFATQPAFGGGLAPTINLMERAEPHRSAYNALAKVEGPTCFGGCLELCHSTTFKVSRMQPAQLESRLEVADLATIVKRKPNSLEGALREMVTDADVYTIVFNPGAALAPQQKATMLAGLLLADYMFFERDDPMCGNGGCNLCLCHCAGCVCPCSIRGNASGGGGAGGGGGGGFMADQ